MLLSNVSAYFAFLVFAAGIIESCSKKNQPAATGATLFSFEPAAGARGQFVKIDGTNFSAAAADNLVFFNNISAVVTSATPNSLVAVVPDGAGSGKISVEINGQKEISANTFDYLLSVSTLAGDGSFGSRDGQGKSAQFYLPFGGGVDAAGNIYVADQGNNLIRKLSPGGLVATVAGNGTRGFADGNALEAQFSSPYDVAADASGNLYVTDGNRIRKISTAGIVSTIAGNDTSAFADGPGAVAKFNSPAGITLDASGNIYVADQSNNRIRKISPDGLVSTIAGNGVDGFRDGAAADAEFGLPFGVAVDASGNVYVSDLENLRIRKISGAGSVSTLAGTSTTGYKDGNAATAEFGSTLGISVDGSGNVYVADGINNVIRKIDPSGTVSTFAGDGKEGGNEAPVSSAEFRSPADILVGGNGTFYVIDYLNNRVCKIL